MTEEEFQDQFRDDDGPDVRMSTRARDDLIEDAAQQAYLDGFIDGLREYAWWKDGIQYVGTCGTTLEEAIKHARANR